MSIAVITIIGDNYGSVLQAYSLQKCFNEEGADSFLLEIENRFSIKKIAKTVFRLFNKKSRKKELLKLYSRYRNNKKFKKVRLFYKENIALHTYRNIKSIEHEEQKVTTFCCGSDQVWNPMFQPSRFLYADFNVSNKVHFCSYAASIGVSDIDNKSKDYYHNYLNKFSEISVRENEGKKVLENIFPNKTIRVDVDPVLLHDAFFWAKKCSGRFEGQSYIFLYMLRPIPELVELAKKVSKKLSLPIYYIGDYYEKSENLKMICDAGVSDFLDIITNADIVITNSFHGTVFSTLFHKNFCSYAVSGTGSRVHSYLDKIELKDRLIDLNFNLPINYFNNNINWEKTDTLISKLRKESKEYIKSIADRERNYV